MNLQYITIFFYVYLFGGILFYFYIEKVIKDIIENDELFDKFEKSLYDTTGFSISKSWLWEAIHIPRVMIIYILIYPAILLSQFIKLFSRRN